MRMYYATLTIMITRYNQQPQSIRTRPTFKLILSFNYWNQWLGPMSITNHYPIKVSGQSLTAPLILGCHFPASGFCVIVDVFTLNNFPIQLDIFIKAK